MAASSSCLCLSALVVLARVEMIIHGDCVAEMAKMPEASVMA
jgi:hypothetical protein